MIDISVIIPIYNEEKNIRELYERLRDTLVGLKKSYEMIFVNDASRDESLTELMSISREDTGVFYIDFSRNFGHQIAVSAGLDACRGQAVVIIDGDLQDPPELIAELYSKYREGYDIVYARRRERAGETFFKKTSAKMFYRILQGITSINIPLDTGDFRLIDRKVVENLKAMPEKNKFLRGQIAWLGYNQAEVLFDRSKRYHGKTSYSFGKMLSFAIDGITGFSDKPLKLVTNMGLLFSFLSFSIIIYALFSYFVLNKTITGWTSLMVSSMFIGGIQLISLGIIGEYLSRMNKNILNRPLYIIKKSNLQDE